METLNEKIKNRDNAKFLAKPHFPTKNLLLELSNICNHKCIFCANRKMTRKKNIMTNEIILKALKQSYELGCREVGFYATGEPLINKNIFFALETAKKLGYEYCYITTNGSLCNLETFKKLIDCGLDSIKFSINALDKKSYYLIHGVDDFEKVINNLKTIFEYRNKNNIKCKIFVSFIGTKFTNFTVETIKTFFSGFCDDVLAVNVRNQSGLMPEVSELLSNGDDKEKIASQRNLPCHYAFNAITISCEGFVTACCTDYQNYLAYGNLNKQNLKDIWHNEIITKLREQHLNKHLENNLCKNCIYNCKNIVSPLDENLCTKIDEKIFDISEAQRRIKEYEKLFK